MIIFIYLFIFFGFANLVPAEAAEYAVARTFAPVLNSPDFKKVFGGTTGQDLKTDRCGQVRELEFIALPGSVFTIRAKLRFGTTDIYQVATNEYPAPPNVSLYVDGRFLKVTPYAQPRTAMLPPREEIIASLKSAVGSPYVWGGNVKNGVPELASRFFINSRQEDQLRLTLSGLDCSGLLYQATGGWTPRNTTQLVAFGKSVAIAGKQATEIASLLQPLDLIVWNGHVVIVLDRHTVIESRLECGRPGNGGVVTSPLPTRLAEIMRKRKPADSWESGSTNRAVFVVRRWQN